MMFAIWKQLNLEIMSKQKESNQVVNKNHYTMIIINSKRKATRDTMLLWPFFVCVSQPFARKTEILFSHFRKELLSSEQSCWDYGSTNSKNILMKRTVILQGYSTVYGRPWVKHIQLICHVQHGSHWCIREYHWDWNNLKPAQNAKLDRLCLMLWEEDKQVTWPKEKICC